MSVLFTDAQLAAFLDGTLADEALIDAIEAAINADPDLAARAEALAIGHELNPLLQSAFAPLLDAPSMPANDAARGSWGWAQFGAMAASLALGVMIGGPLLKGGSDAPQGDGLILASAELDEMLDTAPSGQRVDLAALGKGEVVLTFRNIDGQLCRQFMIESAGGTTSDALACAGAAEEEWQIEAYGRRAAPIGEMRLAGGDAAPAVIAAVDAMIDSDPLIGADEATELSKK
ncbi:MAG: hypothetical protein OHK0018_04700 [Erythrobacter tepidarius]